VYSGSLRRQLDTAGPCARALGRTVCVDARFDEYADRDVLGHHSHVHAGLERQPGDQPLTTREFQEILNGALRGWIAAGAGGAATETWPAFLGRLRDGLAEVAGGLGKGETALVFSSGGSIAALVASLLGLPAEAMITLNHVTINTGITKLAVGRGGTTVVSFNEHAHLDEAGGSLVTYR
jgi:broad specificity phosphatase PhoE